MNDDLQLSFSRQGTNEKLSQRVQTIRSSEQQPITKMMNIVSFRQSAEQEEVNIGN